MGNSIQHCAAAYRGDIDRQFPGIIGEGGDLLNGAAKLYDGVGAVTMFASSMRAPTRNSDSPSGPSLPRDDHEMLGTQTPFGFKHQRRDCVPVESIAAQLTKIRGISFLGRIPK